MLPVANRRPLGNVGICTFIPENTPFLLYTIRHDTKQHLSLHHRCGSRTRNGIVRPEHLMADILTDDIS
jgi:hypothetical protein